MSDEFIIILVLGFWASVIGGGLWLIVRLIRWGATHQQNKQAEAERIQSASEARALELLAEFPDFDDVSLGQMMHDELMNRRAPVEWFAWANAQTVGRMRRTALLHAARKERKAAKKKSA